MFELISRETRYDIRGSVSFHHPSFKLSKFDRFYLVKNLKVGQVRAWHGHIKESKAIVVTQGVGQFCAIEIDDWKNPSQNLTIDSKVISSESSEILIVPPGHVNGFKSLTNDLCVLFLSDKSVTESLEDDFRFPFNFWNPWEDKNF